MASNKQRGSRVIYVAASVRQLPQPVQHWLAEVTEAVACPNIYDALAVLATGKRPAVLVVAIEDVDFSELEFFDHVMRLSPKTAVYVTGHAQQMKLDAAISRGAQLFDPCVADERLSELSGVAADAGPAGLVAGSTRSSGSAAGGGRSGFHCSTASKAAGSEEPAPTEAPPLRWQSPAVDAPAPVQLPPVRLVASTDEEEAAEPPVVFPWSPSPNRPQRTPPGQHRPPSGTKVEVSPEELSALLGKPAAAKLPSEEMGQ